MTNERFNELHTEVLTAPTLRLAVVSAIEIGKYINRECLDRGRDWRPEGTDANYRQLTLYIMAAMLWRNAADCFPGNVERQLWSFIDETDEAVTTGEAARQSVDAHARANEAKSLRLVSLAEQLEAEGMKVIAALRLERTAFREGVTAP